MTPPGFTCKRPSADLALPDGPLPTHPSAFALGKATPDPELLAHLDGVVQALVLHLALSTDRLGLPGRSSSLREEKVCVGATAVRVVLPGELTYGQGFELTLPDGAPFDEIWSQTPVPVGLGARTVGESVCYRRGGLAILAGSEGRNSPIFEVVRVRPKY